MSNILNNDQHIFPGERKILQGRFSPLRHLVTGLRLRSAHALISHRDKIKTIVSDEVNYRGTQS